MTRTALALLASALACAGAPRAASDVASRSTFPGDYRCVPFHDARYARGPQSIPGRIENEYYDTMDVPADRKKSVEEGTCYHDTDTTNSGSGTLNGTGSYINEFRMGESPDISYTKFGHAGVAIDDSPYNLVVPEANSLYLGWIAPGEWVRYTVNVASEGWYSITTMYTSKLGGRISLDVDGVDATGPLALPITYAAADTIDWRQAHHWNRVAGLGRFRLPAGKHLLTLHFLDHPVMNFDYMEFVRVP